MTDKKREPLHENVTNGIIGWVVIGAVTMWIANFMFGIYYEWSDAPNGDRGTFGDVFGAVNSVFSGFAFVGVVWSLILQRQELRYAKEDRSETLSTMKLQRFENTFFQLFDAFTHVITNLKVMYRIEDIDTQHGITQTVTLSDADHQAFPSGDFVTKTGAEALSAVSSLLEIEYRHLVISSKKPKLEVIHDAYEHIFKDYLDEMGRYTRTLYTLVQFVDSSEINDKIKPFYVKLIRAQLSEVESTFIAINFLSPHTTPEFNALKAKYGLAKNANKKNKLLVMFKDEIAAGIYGKTHERKELMAAKERAGETRSC